MGALMDYQELSEKYKTLLEEVTRLKIENSQLKAELGLKGSQPVTVIQPEIVLPSKELSSENCHADVNNSSDSVSNSHSTPPFSKMRHFSLGFNII